MKIKRLIAFFLCICLTAGIVRSYGVHSSAKAIKLSKNTISLTVGGSKTLKVSNYNNKAKWSVITGVDYISLSKKARKSVKIKAKMPGTAVVQCKAGKKKLTCKVTVSAKKKALVFQEASWPFRNPAAVVPTPSSSSSSSSSGNNSSASNKNKSGVDDIFYYDLDYTDDKGNLITSEVPASATTKAGATTNANATTEAKKDKSDDPDVPDEIYDDDEYYGDENDEDDGAIVNVAGKHPDDVAALVAIIEAKRAAGSAVPTDLDSPAYDWGIEEVNARLEGINLSVMDITGELDLNAFPELANINVSDNSITKLSVDKLKKLEELNIANNAFSKFELSNMPALETLKCSDCESLSTLKVTGCKILNDIALDGCESLKTVDFTDDIAIGELSISGYDLTALTLKNCTGLVFLDCSENRLTTLDLMSCSAIEEVNCNNNSLTQIKLNGLKNLVSVDCSFNSLTTVTCKDCVELMSIDCNNNKLKALDVSSSKEITFVDITNNPSLPARKVVFNAAINLNENGGDIDFMADDWPPDE